MGASRLRFNILLHIIPTRYTIHRVYFYLTLLYMFRALLSPIVFSCQLYDVGTLSHPPLNSDLYTQLWSFVPLHSFVLTKSLSCSNRGDWFSTCPTWSSWCYCCFGGLYVSTVVIVVASYTAGIHYLKNQENLYSFCAYYCYTWQNFKNIAWLEIDVLLIAKLW